MIINYDFIDPDCQRAVLYTQAARQGRRVEIGLQVYNNRIRRWVKVLFTQLLAGDIDGIGFELLRLYDKAQAAGYKCIVYNGKEVTL